MIQKLDTAIDTGKRSAVWFGEDGKFVSAEAYHADYDKIGKSMIDDFRYSPGYFKGRYITGDIAAPEPTPSMMLGTLLDIAVFDPKRFGADYFVPPELAPDGEPWDRRKKEHKQWWAEVEADPRTQLTVKDSELIRGMRAALVEHFVAANLLWGEPISQQPLWWQDDETGLICKCLRDTLARGGQLIVDLKSAIDPSPSGFAKACVNFGYHRQAAHYLDGHKAVFGEPAQGFVFVVVGKEPPHDVAVYELNQEAVTLGRQQIRSALYRMADCYREGVWKAPHESQINTLGLPGYAFTENQWELEQ